MYSATALVPDVYLLSWRWATWETIWRSVLRMHEWIKVCMHKARLLGEFWPTFESHRIRKRRLVTSQSLLGLEQTFQCPRSICKYRFKPFLQTLALQLLKLNLTAWKAAPPLDRNNNHPPCTACRTGLQLHHRPVSPPQPPQPPHPPTNSFSNFSLPANSIWHSYTYPGAWINSFVAGGLIYLHYTPHEKWTSPWHTYLPIIVLFLLSNVFLALVPFIPPTGPADPNGYPYFIFPVVGVGVLLLGVIYWAGWTKILPRVGGYKVVAERKVLEDGAE